MQNFGYVKAVTLAEAVKFLNEPEIISRPLAGGTDILLQLRHDPLYCDRLVDISQLTSLHSITLQDGWVRIGAAATFSEVLDNPVVSATAPVLAQACASVGAVQIRNMGTLGGNVANASACADSLPALVCLDAVAKIISLEGELAIPVGQFVVSPNQTMLKPGDLLVSLDFPVPVEGSRSAFLKLGRRNAMAISRLTVAALGRLDSSGVIAEARLVTGSATPRIERLGAVEESLVGQKPTASLFQDAAKMTVDEMIRLAGYRWSSEFKIPALTAMTERVFAQIFTEVEAQ